MERLGRRSLNEPKSKNYQDGKDKEDNRRNPVARAHAHDTIPLKNVRYLANGDSTHRLSHRRNFSVRPSPFGAVSLRNGSGSFILHMALTGASCSDTNEYNFRSCARLAH